MKVWPEQFEQHLTGPLERVCLISGDEPLLMQEAADHFRAAARAQGFDERELHYADARYDWSGLALATGTLSLFSTQRLIEIRLAKPLGAEGGKALKLFAEQAAADTVVLVVSPKLDSKAPRAAWYKALEKVATTVQLYPIDGDKLQAWISKRMRTRGLQPDADAVRLLAEREEGNLLACVQDIEKLALLHGEGAINAEQVEEAVSDNARFDVFALGDAALAGSSERVVRIIGNLRAEGIAAPLVLWVLSREIRTLAQMAAAVAAGQALDQVAGRAWPKKRVPVTRAALQRVSVGRCRRLLEWAARIDGSIKGADPAATWDGLLALGVGLAARGRPPVGF